MEINDQNVKLNTWFIIYVKEWFHEIKYKILIVRISKLHKQGSSLTIIVTRFDNSWFKIQSQYHIGYLMSIVLHLHHHNHIISTLLY